MRKQHEQSGGASTAGMPRALARQLSCSTVSDSQGGLDAGLFDLDQPLVLTAIADDNVSSAQSAFAHAHPSAESNRSHKHVGPRPPPFLPQYFHTRTAHRTLARGHMHGCVCAVIAPPRYAHVSHRILGSLWSDTVPNLISRIVVPSHGPCSGFRANTGLLCIE